MKCLNKRNTCIGSTLFIVALAACPKVTESQSHAVQRRSTQRPQIVFVCEHGAALSVVAAAYFNKLAQDRHLNLHATARGTTPQKDIAVSAREGLTLWNDTPSSLIGEGCSACNPYCGIRSNSGAIFEDHARRDMGGCASNKGQLWIGPRRDSQTSR